MELTGYLGEKVPAKGGVICSKGREQVINNTVKEKIVREREHKGSGTAS